MNRVLQLLRKKQVRIGVMVYAAVFFAVVLIANLDAINRFLAAVLDVISPILIGLVIAYLANPIFRFWERRALVHIRYQRLRRALSLLLTYLVLLLIIAGLFLLIVPQFLDSIRTFLGSFDEYVYKVTDLLNGGLQRINARFPNRADGSPAIHYLNAESIILGANDLIRKLPSHILAIFPADSTASEQILPTLLGLISQTTTLITDLIFGIFVSIYLLSSKEKRYAQILKFRRAYLGDGVNQFITRVTTVADRSFGSFLRGKLIDSAIVGFLVYIVCLIFRIPYAVLVAVIVGITDVIPVIGPFIGVIPSAVIILLTAPEKFLIFVLAILVIQQLDGNVIAPKILGENTGVSSLCVLIAILVMGDLMGLVGMLIGVPLFATIIELFKGYLNRRVREKQEAGEDIPLVVDEPTEKPLPEPDPALPLCAAMAKDGNLSPREQLQLRAYALAKKHGVFADTSDASLTAFAQEAAALFQETEADKTQNEGQDDATCVEESPVAEIVENEEQGGADA